MEKNPVAVQWTPVAGFTRFAAGIALVIIATAMTFEIVDSPATAQLISHGGFLLLAPFFDQFRTRHATVYFGVLTTISSLYHIGRTDGMSAVTIGYGAFSVTRSYSFWARADVATSTGAFCGFFLAGAVRGGLVYAPAISTVAAFIVYHTMKARGEASSLTVASWFVGVAVVVWLVAFLRRRSISATRAIALTAAAVLFGVAVGWLWLYSDNYDNDHPYWHAVAALAIGVDLATSLDPRYPPIMPRTGRPIRRAKSVYGPQPPSQWAVVPLGARLCPDLALADPDEQLRQAVRDNTDRWLDEAVAELRQTSHFFAQART
jgi:hypothetical protein